MSPKKDWRNHEKRREEALRRGEGVGDRGRHGEGAVDRGHRGVTPPVVTAAPISNYYDNGGYGQPNPAHGHERYGYAPQALAYSAYGSSAQAYGYYDEDYDDYPQRMSDPNYYGGASWQINASPASREGYGPEDSGQYEPSPIEKKRKCRDVICLAFLFAAIVVMVAISAYAIVHGDLRRFTNGVDLNCDICGIENEMKVGVSNSGKDLRYANFLVTQKMRRQKRSDFRFPTDDLPLGNVETLGQVRSSLRECRSKCPTGSKIVLNRCSTRRHFEIENRTARFSVEDVTDAVEEVNLLIDEIAEDLETAWKDILWICLISLGVAILVTILLRLFAGIIIWVIVFIVSLSAIGGSVALWYFWLQVRQDQGQGSWTSTEVTGLLVSAIIVSILTLILLVVLFFMRRRIGLVIKLFNEAGKAVHAMPLVLFQPLLVGLTSETFLALGIAFATWMTVALLIETSGQPILEGQMRGQAQNDTMPNCYYQKDAITMFSRWWNIFMVIWMTQFILGCQHLVIAGAVSVWYFTRNKSRLGFPLALSYKRLIRYHLGSVAFGSLIIAIVKFIRLILNTIRKRLGGENVFCRAMLWCCQCFVWCLEKFLIFLSENAYIEIAIYGHAFCKSARKAFSAISNNALRLAAINSIGDFVLFLAKLSIVALSVFIGYELIKNKGDIHHVWVPLSLGGIFAFFVAHCFISVYEIAIDTVFLCFCEDSELNDGLHKPYYMTKGLREFVKTSEKLLAESEKKNERKQERDAQ